MDERLDRYDSQPSSLERVHSRRSAVGRLWARRPANTSRGFEKDE
jgi:hypothetical protein